MPWLTPPPDQVVSYNEANKHWFASSSNKPACVVKVASAVDVAVVLQIVGASRTPFAVYSGGHASNPGFSSTTGVHITLDRLRDVALSEDQQTVKLGFGAVRPRDSVSWQLLTPGTRHGKTCTRRWSPSDAMWSAAESLVPASVASRSAAATHGKSTVPCLLQGSPRADSRPGKQTSMVGVVDWSRADTHAAAG